MPPGRPKIYDKPEDRPSHYVPTGRPRGRPRKSVGASDASAASTPAAPTPVVASSSRTSGQKRKVVDSSSVDSAASSDRDDEEDEEEEADDFEPDLSGLTVHNNMKCCTDKDVSGKILVCGKRAVKHTAAHKYHLECTSTSASFRGEWRCSECDAASGDVASEPEITEDESSDDEGVTPDRKRSDVFKMSTWPGPFIFEERLALDGEAMEYRMGSVDDATARWLNEKFVPPRVRQEYHIIDGKARQATEGLPSATVPVALKQNRLLREANEEWNEMLTHLRRGYWSLSRAIYPDVKAGTRLNDFPRVDLFQSLMDKILCQMHPLALEGICGEGLRRLRVLDDDLAEMLDLMMSLSRNHPCHYVLELCDIRGLAPLCGELRTIIKAVRKYCALVDKQHILLVDSVFHDLESDKVDAINKGATCMYLSGLNSTNQTLHDAMDLCVELIDLIKDLKDDERCPFLLRDVGYTDNGNTRVNKQQRRHRACNKIMGLFEACSVVEFGNKYRIFGDVVLLCAEHIQAEAGEVVLSLIAQSYSKHGRGFNAVEGGAQQQSMAKYPAGDECWSEWQSQAIEQLNFEQNITDERKRRRAYNRKLDLVRQQMANLELEDAQDDVQFVVEASARLDEVLEVDSELAQLLN